MQYDEQELEQLNRMVHRAGNEMSSLLSPPRVCKPSVKSVASGNLSPNGLHLNSSDDEDSRVFFIDDLDGAGEALAGTESSNNAFCDSCATLKRGGSCSDPLRCKQAHHTESCPVLKEMAGWDHSNNNNVEESNLLATTSFQNSCSCFENPDSRLNLCVWDVHAHDAETAEMIAHRTGGMKISATVIFNPKSPSSSESPTSSRVTSGDSRYLADGNGETHQLSVASTNCLVSSCVCCGTCDNSREDNINLKANSCPGKIIKSSNLLKLKEKHHLHKTGVTISVQEPLKTETYILLAENNTCEEDLRLSPASKCSAYPSGSHVELENELKVNKEILGQQKTYERRQTNEKSSETVQEKNERLAMDDRKSRSRSK